MPRIANGDVAIISLCHQMGRRRFTRARSAFATARAQRDRSHGRRVLANGKLESGSKSMNGSATPFAYKHKRQSPVYRQYSTDFRPSHNWG